MNCRRLKTWKTGAVCCLLVTLGFSPSCAGHVHGQDLDESGLALTSLGQSDSQSGTVKTDGSASWHTLDAILIGSDGRSDDHFGASLDVSDDTVVVGATEARTSGIGRALVFQRDTADSGAWYQIADLRPSDGAIGDHFGREVAVDSGTVVVGAQRADVGLELNQGKAYVFERLPGTPAPWTETAILTASDGAAYDSFGFATDIDRNTIVVGASGADYGGRADHGKAYVFERDPRLEATWVQTKILAVDTAAESGAYGLRFGYAVAVSGDTVAIGAWGAVVDGVPDRGKVYVYNRNCGGTGNWGLEAVLIGGIASGDRMGATLDVHGDTIVAGTINGLGDSNSGVYVFERRLDSEGTWDETSTLLVADSDATDITGFSISLEDDTLVVGEHALNTSRLMDHGRLHVFSRGDGDAGAWTRLALVTPGRGEANDLFGWDTGVSGETIVASSMYADVAGNHNQGSAYVFATVQDGKPRPEINVTGNGRSISDSDMRPDVSDGTAFGSTLIEDNPIAHAFTIVNLGATDLHLTGAPRVAISGPNAGGFKIVGEPSEVIPPYGGLAQFTVEFAPTTIGTRSAVISIANDDPDEDPFSFAVQGTCVDESSAQNRGALYLPLLFTSTVGD